MSVDTDYAVLRHILSVHEPKGWAIEFGVFSGTSLRLIAQHMPVIGLDSFDGLPENWRPGFGKGKFGTQGVLPHIGPNAMIVPGWFHETLPRLRDRGIPQLGLVHIDCDLYSSTITALNGIADYIHVGTIVVFDEFHGYEGHEEHEMRAWYEFCVQQGVTAQMVLSGPEEAAFVVEDIYTPGPADLGIV
jgi:hypothetical protein